MDDYDKVAALYERGDLYGGQFSLERDSPGQLKARVEQDPDSILVAEREGTIVGTVSLIEDARVAWLFRFAVLDDERAEATGQALFDRASGILRQRGHREVLVYSPAGNHPLDRRYQSAGFTKGGDYTCYWRML